MSTTIRLTKTKQMEKILGEIQKDFFPLLDDAEIIKMIISDYYASVKQRSKPIWPVRMATKQEEKAIKAGTKDIQEGKYITLKADEPIDLDSLC